MSRGMAWTIRCDSLELWPGLVLHGMGEVDFHVFGKYWKLTSSPNTSKLVLGPPDWSSDFFESQGTISGAIKPINFPKNDTKQTYFPGNWKTSQNHICLIKWLPFLCLFWAPCLQAASTHQNIESGKGKLCGWTGAAQFRLIVLDSAKFR